MTKNRVFILIVCLFVAAFSFTSAATAETETVTTITCKPGTLLSENELLTQLCDTASLRIHSLPGGYGALVVMLNDVDAVQALFHIVEDGLYVQSETLGETPLYFDWADIAALIEEQLQYSVDMGEMNALMGSENYLALLDGSLTEEQMYEMMGVDEEMLAYIEDLQASLIVETGSFAMEGSDLASQKTVMVLTKDDLIRALDLSMVRQQISTQLAMEYSYTQEELDAEVDATLSEAKQAIEESNITITATVLENDDDFVAMEIDLTWDMDDVTEPTGLTMTVTKTTLAEADFYKMLVCVHDADSDYNSMSGSLYMGNDLISGSCVVNDFDGTQILAANFVCDQSYPDTTTAELSFEVSDVFTTCDDAVLLVFHQSVEENITDTMIDVYAAHGTLEELKSSLNASSVITIHLNTVTQEDSGYFADLQSATPDTALQLLNMTEDELYEYVYTIQDSMIATLYTIIENLPAELSNVLMDELNF